MVTRDDSDKGWGSVRTTVTGLITVGMGEKRVVPVQRETGTGGTPGS